MTSEQLLSKYSNDPRERTIIRRELYNATKKDRERKLVCSICNQPLRLCGGGGTKQKLHFRHHQDNDKCPIKTVGNKNQKEIDTIRYNGAKESQRHIELKEFICKQLKHDQRFSHVEPEKVVKILNKKKSWRRPDVSAVFENIKMVFEVQLQTTYLNVIVDREEDYKSEKTYIMWFFDSENIEKFRFSEEDIFYANKSNAFIITDTSIELSRQNNQFLFYCYYKVPFIHNKNIYEKWESKLIGIDDLKFDTINYKVFYHDFELERYKLQWQSKLEQCDIYDYTLVMEDLKTLFKKYNIQNEAKIIKVIFILHSVKQLTAYGWDNDNLIWALNNFFQNHKEYSHLVVKIISSNKLWNDILSKDIKGSFKNKVSQWKIRNANNDETKYNGLFISLFPELAYKNK